jgi:RNA polymerase sigma-54 factor
MGQTQVQKQRLTPQVLQGIQLLQLSREELLSYLNQKALENPFLEVTTYEAEFDSGRQPSSPTSPDLGWIPDTDQSLREFVTEQVLLSYRDTYLREMIFWWINQLDENGYVTKSIEEAADETGASAIQMLDSLTLLQQLEPAGIGARDLRECLMLQTERMDYAPNIAYIVLEESFNDFVERKAESLAKKYDVTLQEVQEVFDFVQKLTANPGALFKQSTTTPIFPELSVSIDSEEIEVKETKYGAPLLSFKKDYAEQLASYEDTEVNRYIKEKQNEYNTLQEQLKQRGETILRVGTAIVSKQKQFFFDKAHPLAPLQLKELAEELNLHESTISRAVNDTYIQTDTGTYELKTFFSRKHHQEDYSTDSIQQALIQLIEKEDKQKPHSDQVLVNLLKEKGFDISRRTIAKYRTQLNIPSSTKRKRFD